MVAGSLLTRSKVTHIKQITGIWGVILVTTVLFLFTAGCTGSAGAVSSSAGNDLATNNNTTQKPALSEPEIRVAVNGGELQNGTRITTGEDPRLSMDIRSATPIESTILRIDGQTRRTYSPNSTNFSTTTTLELRDGGHRVTVIATGDSTTIYSVTIVKDAIAPRINFEEPFVTTGAQPPDKNYTVNTSNITLRGQLIDRSAVQRVIIEHRYEYSFNGVQTERSRYVIDDPGELIAQRLRLGPNRKNQTNGTNYIFIELSDTKDNYRTYTFSLNISDNRPPSIAILGENPLYEESTVALKIRVTDNVGIATFGQRLGSGNETGIQSYYSENDIYQQRREYVTTVEFPATLAGNGITLWATDLVGNNAEINYSLAYASFVSPKITINTEATLSLERQTARVVGTISEGVFSHVEIEARSSNGTLSDLAVVNSSEKNSRIEFNETIQVDSYPASVQVRVQDVAGSEHIRDYQITRTDPQQPSQPTPDISTETVPPPTQPKPTTTETKQDAPTPTATPSKTTTAHKTTVRTTATQGPSPVESILGYLMSVLPYTLGSAFLTIILYVIARKSIAG